MLEEHPDVPAVGLHQAVDVGHGAEQQVGGGQAQPLPLIMSFQQKIDEGLVDAAQDLVLSAEVVIQRRLGYASSDGDLLHRDAGVAVPVEEPGGQRDDLGAALVRGGRRGGASHGVFPGSHLSAHSGGRGAAAASAAAA
jgi:hypothetical protein